MVLLYRYLLLKLLGLRLLFGRGGLGCVCPRRRDRRGGNSGSERMLGRSYKVRSEYGYRDVFVNVALLSPTKNKTPEIVTKDDIVQVDWMLDGSGSLPRQKLLRLSR